MMYVWQVLLFCIGCFIPVSFMPHPVPKHMEGQPVWLVYFGFGVALAWLGSVGISHLLSFARGIGKRRTGTGPERIARRP